MMTDGSATATPVDQKIGSVPLTMPNESCSSLERNPMTHQFNDNHTITHPSNVSPILPPNLPTSDRAKMNIQLLGNPINGHHDKQTHYKSFMTQQQDQNVPVLSLLLSK
ncbi:hypothetical protein Ddc_10773 [Ditylenchus destructor]|nr:hypothetical protein Ddc_10773 [Ditylenchus destructor]